MPLQCSLADRFPKYKPKDNKVSIWSESYGGHYGPSFAAFFAEQARKTARGAVADCSIPLQVDTVGIVNGCIDILTQISSYPQMAYNNSYGIEVINEAEYNAAINSFPECRDRVNACQSLADTKDPRSLGNVAEVNKACVDAYDYCMGTMAGGVESRGVSLQAAPLLNLTTTADHRHRETSLTLQPRYPDRSPQNMPAGFSTPRKSSSSWAFRSTCLVSPQRPPPVRRQSTKMQGVN